MAENKANLPRKRNSEKSTDVSGRYSLSRLSEFAGEVKREFSKIAWPNKKNTLASSMVVIVFVSIMAFYLGAVDLFIGKLVSYILN